MSQKSVVALCKAAFETLLLNCVAPDLKILARQASEYGLPSHHLMPQPGGRLHLPLGSVHLKPSHSGSPHQLYSLFLLLSYLTVFFFFRPLVPSLSEPGQSCTGAVSILGTCSPVHKGLEPVLSTSPPHVAGAPSHTPQPSHTGKIGCSTGFLCLGNS